MTLAILTTTALIAVVLSTLGLPTPAAAGIALALLVMPLRPATVLVALAAALAIGYLSVARWVHHHPDLVTGPTQTTEVTR